MCLLPEPANSRSEASRFVVTAQQNAHWHAGIDEWRRDLRGVAPTCCKRGKNVARHLQEDEKPEKLNETGPRQTRYQVDSSLNHCTSNFGITGPRRVFARRSDSHRQARAHAPSPLRQTERGR